MSESKLSGFGSAKRKSIWCPYNFLPIICANSTKRMHVIVMGRVSRNKLVFTHDSKLGKKVTMITRLSGNQNQIRMRFFFHEYILINVGKHAETGNMQ